MNSNKAMETTMKWVFLISAATSILALAAICYFIFARGIPFIAGYGFTDFLFGEKWAPTSGTYGIAPMIVGSLYMTLIAVVLGVPTGVFTAVFMAFYCPPKLHKILKPAVNLMAGIPSIVFGYFGLVVLVPAIRDFARSMRIASNGMSILTAGIILAIMILPTIISMSESSLRAVPKTYYQASVGLGATHDRTAYRIMVPAARSGILASIILGIGRAIGETMAVIMVAGNQAIFPRGLFYGARTMTANIVLEMAYASGEHQNALIATGAVLFVFILIINSIFAIVKRQGVK
ncbi:phosphate ABC transporter permease subunit PstC [Aerococcus kribbianus]|uniref:Phosphate transport system permease protein n=1 Tax=Aerococcus kribbianus TaxID=2999064 RepID=A0A9X3FQ36_9LACT|nr:MULTISPECIES: phosphate ABC transporter permease subunit PstC [unclassified Aerococcus]MCZ0717496.1 phosphate ABC transporter permease subunit PstC [Aerococcus sp. YH-aer221]MCZ0725784.1 phosphate ABC transporter permease subunit PstC [Aerococcus sp. YH-aer222]